MVLPNKQESEAATNLKQSQLYNQMMSRLPGCLFKFIQKQPPGVFILLLYLRKKTEMERVVLRNFSQNSQRKHLCVRVSFLKSIKKETFAQLFSSEFRDFFFHRTILAIMATASNKCCFFLLLFFSTSLSQLARYSQVAILYSLCLFCNLAIFYDSCSYLSSVLFLIPKTEFVSSFAFVLCYPFPSGFLQSTERFQTVLLIKKYEALFSRLFLAPSESNQNIQDNPGYNSVLPLRIILKTFALNMLVPNVSLSVSVSNFLLPLT